VSDFTVLLADDIPPHTFWNAANASGEWWIKVIVCLLLVSAVLFITKDAGPRVRKYIVGGITFIAGAFYVLYFLWPSPVNRKPDEIPGSVAEHISFYLDDALPIVATIANIIGAFLLGLGGYSVLNIHIRKVSKQQRDWGFSLVLLVCLFAMLIIGYWDWHQRKIDPGGARLDLASNWTTVNYINDFLFDGLFQQMDAAMFSIIAFYILSAAYRAFRIRSVEATILLGSAFIVILSLMGALEYLWTHSVVNEHSTFTLTEIAKWLRDSFQTPAIRAIDFGVGVGALAMGLRLWLSLEKQGAN